MLKRILPVFALLGMCALSAFSLDVKTANKSSKAPFSLSAGGRIFYNGIFGISESKWTGHSGDGKEAYFESAVEPFIYLANGFGIGGFFDAVYVEIGMDLIFGSFKPGYDSFDYDFELKSTQFGFSIAAGSASRALAASSGEGGASGEDEAKRGSHQFLHNLPP